MPLSLQLCLAKKNKQLSVPQRGQFPLTQRGAHRLQEGLTLSSLEGSEASTGDCSKVHKHQRGWPGARPALLPLCLLMWVREEKPRAGLDSTGTQGQGAASPDHRASVEPCLGAERMAQAGSGRFSSVSMGRAGSNTSTGLTPHSTQETSCQAFATAQRYTQRSCHSIRVVDGYLLNVYEL